MEKVYHILSKKAREILKKFSRRGGKKRQYLKKKSMRNMQKKFMNFLHCFHGETGN